MLSFGVATKKKTTVSCFSWGFPGFSGRLSKKAEVGRGRNTEISHLYPSAVSSFRCNLLKAPVISGIPNPSCLGTGNLHPYLTALERNSELRVAPPKCLDYCWDVDLDCSKCGSSVP